jgi:hypothetical protein
MQQLAKLMCGSSSATTDATIDGESIYFVAPCCPAFSARILALFASIRAF